MNCRSLLVGSTLVLTTLTSVSICLALQQQDRGVDVVVAAADIQIGTKLDESVLQIVTLPSSLAPSGAYKRKSQVVGSIVTLPVIKNELLLPTKVAAPDSNPRLLPPEIVSVAIPAVTVRANGVALADDGSVPRPTLADVLLAKSASGPRDPQTDEIWPGVMVMAVTSRVEHSDGGDTRLTPVVTFLMNLPAHAAEYAHQLALAGAEHRVWVALRGVPDTRSVCRSNSTQPVSEHVERPILVSHKDFTGCCGDSSTTDLKVFPGGAVTFTEDSIGINQKARKMERIQLSCATDLDVDDMRDLARILDSQGVQDLPAQVLRYPKGRPIDSGSTSSFKINRAEATQEIHVELSPITQWPPISKPDPEALTKLDCAVEEIKAKTIKSSAMPEGWVRPTCYEVLDQHFRPMIVGRGEALKLLASGRDSLRSVVIDGVGRAWFVLMETKDAPATAPENPQALELSLQRAEFNERLKSDFGEN